MAVTFFRITTMKKLPLLLFFFFLFISAKSQPTSVPNDQDFVPSQANSVTTFQPSLPVVIGMLSIMFSLTFILLLYAKFCHAHSPPHDDRPPPLPWRSSDAVDKTLIESLPSFRFSLLKGSRDGLECAVCLSKFVDVEILRLLPKCKHAFHVDCIDQWLCKRSSCPLCRQKVGKNDLSQMPYSDSFRFLWDRDRSDPSGFELYVQREEEKNKKFASSRFRSSEEVRIQETVDLEENKKSGLHRFNHRIVLTEHDRSADLLKSRWSNVGSSDIMFLRSEMLGHESSARFSRLDSRSGEERFGSQRETVGKSAFGSGSQQNERRLGSDSSGKRSMSEITLHPRRLSDLRIGNRDGKDERMRRMWLPIARNTIHWLANREEREAIQHK